MEIRVLRYFLEAARECNITRAAARLNLSQPTITRQLHQLEEELGVKLFTRGRVNIMLTREGLLLKERAKEIIEMEEKTKTDLSSVQKDISGTVCIGAGETVGMHFIGQVLRELIEHHKKVHYRVISGDREGVAEKLDKGLIDFGVFVGKVNLEKYDYLVLPDVDTWGVLLLKDDQLVEQGFVRPEDLLERPLLSSYQAMAEGEFVEWLGYPVERLNVVGLHNLMYNASVMVREGIGIVLTIDGIIDTSEQSDFRFVPLKPEMTARLVLAWRKDAVFSPAAGKFLELAREELDV